MLYYDGIDISEKIDVNKTSKSKECDICHYWYFLDNEFNFQSHVCNGCYDLLMMPMSLSNIAITIISGSSKNVVINLMQNINLTKISRTL